MKNECVANPILAFGGVDMMNNRMVKLLKGKNIYVDVDGTLAEYRFNDHVSAKDGTTNGQTTEEIENHVFLHSRPLKSVIKTLAKASKDDDTGIWVCGAIISPVELLDKIEWLKTNCGDIQFNGEFWFVPEEYWNTFLKYFADECNHRARIIHKDVNELCEFDTKYGSIIKGSKNQMWDWIVHYNLHPLEKTVFIDDVLTYLKYAEENGVTAYHISSFVD